MIADVIKPLAYFCIAFNLATLLVFILIALAWPSEVSLGGTEKTAEI